MNSDDKLNNFFLLKEEIELVAIVKSKDERKEDFKFEWNKTYKATPIFGKPTLEYIN